MPTSFAIVDPVLATVIDVPMMDQPTLSATDPHARPVFHECHVQVVDNLGHNVANNRRKFRSQTSDNMER